MLDGKQKTQRIYNMIHAIVGAVAGGCVVGGLVVGIVLLLEPLTKNRKRGR